MKAIRILDFAKREVKGFDPLQQKLEQKVLLCGLSSSNLLNDGRCAAKISLHCSTPAHLL